MPLLLLNDLLRGCGLDPAKVLVLRNTEPSLRSIFPYLAAERSDLFRAYQQVQGPRLEAALKRAIYMASFIGQGADQALFVAIYEVERGPVVDHASFHAVPEHQELRDLGYAGLAEGQEAIRFRLTETKLMDDWSGRLLIRWPGSAVSWWRWAHKNEFPVEAILAESFFERPVPDWKDLALTWAQLSTLPQKWKLALSYWRGIYYIYDSERRAGYVGSAYGADNILGRWTQYAASGHGGNKLLKDSRPESLRFSILQRTSPDLAADEVIQLEATWKERLHTRTYRLNAN